MRIDILTVVPELLTSPLNESILHRAQEKGLVRIVVHNLHDYAHDRRKTTDDYPFGGEAGMVLKCEPVFELVEKLQSERHYDEIIYTSPDGIRYDQHEANRLSTLENIIILCGHYKGIDHRIREHLITREISIGDYVLTGGELAGRGLMLFASTVSFLAWMLISPIWVRNTNPSIPMKSPKSSKRLNTVLYISLSSSGQMSSRVIYTWMRPLESCNSMKDALPMIRRLMIRPATDTWRGSASSLNSALISVEKAFVTYSAAG